jgi:hypothetical protein
MEVFRLFGSILIDDKDALKSLNQTEKKAKDNEKAMQDLGKKAGEVGKAIAIGIGVAVTALGGLVMKSAEATDRIDKMSAKVGLSRESFQKWDYVMSQNGISIDSMQGSMAKLTNVIDDAKKGNKTAISTFDRLGVSIEDMQGKSKDEIFDMMIAKLQGVTDETERAAIANDIFGRSGSELAPLLNAGADATERLKQKAYDLGLILSDETIDAGVVFSDTVDDMKRSVGAIATQIGVEVMPIVQKLLDWVMEHMPTIKEVMGNVFNAIADSIKWLSDNANWLIPILAGVLGGFLALKIIGVVTALVGAFNVIMAAAAAAGGLFNLVMLANPLTWVVLGIVAVIAAITLLIMNFDKVKAAAGKLWDGIKDIFGKIGDFVKGIFDGFKNIIKLPKFEVKGSLNPITWLKDGLPKLNVKWNAEGAIFNRPTIFGTSAGYQGVGEAGAEAVMPIEKLQDMINWNALDPNELAKAIRKELNGFAVVMDAEKYGEFIDLRLMKAGV